MSEPDTTNAPAERRAPKNTRTPLTELTLLVRDPNNRGHVRAFTADEADDAVAYALSVDGRVENLN